ncbi:hypothetical protein PI23P_08055 [Polaribacter irgensii 23-P]|uniref:Gliding motility protein GldL-like N-terminal domain-containing protein n=1 Tax=Polaribacter irgensii 23-P TaxID=313594 RepID=A4BZH0_9FLAO|nr:hypothetical protein [Polaribacter irgensii]EAR12563.1 hypothetical protein PI23P_08055 [Polaribacter irgensii 23-P]
MEKNIENKKMKHQNMEIRQTNKIMYILNGISATLIIIGAILKISHNEYGNLIISIGFISAYFIDNIEINRLKKIIKQLEKENTLKN